MAHLKERLVAAGKGAAAPPQRSFVWWASALPEGPGPPAHSTCPRALPYDCGGAAGGAPAQQGEPSPSSTLPAWHPQQLPRVHGSGDHSRSPQRPCISIHRPCLARSSRPRSSTLLERAIDPLAGSPLPAPAASDLLNRRAVAGRAAAAASLGGAPHPAAVFKPRLLGGLRPGANGGRGRPDRGSSAAR